MSQQNQLSIFPKECTALFVSDFSTCYVRYWDERGELWVFGGEPSQKLEAMRAVGREAADLESSFSWDDAATVNECIRRYWPDVEPTQICNCKACRERREVKAEVAVIEKIEVRRKPKWDWLVMLFFAVVIIRSRVRKFFRKG